MYSVYTARYAHGKVRGTLWYARDVTDTVTYHTHVRTTVKEV